MRFLIDAQLPPALCLRMHEKGHDALHVAEIGLGDASDLAIWSYAVSHQMVIVTKDSDFAELAQHRSDAAAVIWIRLGNVTVRTLWTNFEPLLPEILEALNSGERLIEIA